MPNDPRVRPHKRKKVCQFCVDKATSIDYKDTADGAENAVVLHGIVLSS